MCNSVLQTCTKLSCSDPSILVMASIHTQTLEEEKSEKQHFTQVFTVGSSSENTFYSIFHLQYQKVPTRSTHVSSLFGWSRRLCQMQGSRFDSLLISTESSALNIRPRKPNRTLYYAVQGVAPSSKVGSSCFHYRIQPSISSSVAMDIKALGIDFLEQCRTVVKLVV